LTCSSIPQGRNNSSHKNLNSRNHKNRRSYYIRKRSESTSSNYISLKHVNDKTASKVNTNHSLITMTANYLLDTRNSHHSLACFFHKTIPIQQEKFIIIIPMLVTTSNSKGNNYNQMNNNNNNNNNINK